MTDLAVSQVVRAALDDGTSTCYAWPEQDEGPYYRPDVPRRREVVEDAPGVALTLGLRLVDGTRAPLVDASIEIWHCDALGRYSGFPPPEPQTTYVADRMFLRGLQHTDATGTVEFHTVYPGWYPGRTIHVHVRAHARGNELTSQLYFPEQINELVLGRSPYAARQGRDTTNEDDSIAATGGGPAVLDVRHGRDSYVATTRLVLAAGAAR